MGFYNPYAREARGIFWSKTAYCQVAVGASDSPRLYVAELALCRRSACDEAKAGEG